MLENVFSKFTGAGHLRGRPAPRDIHKRFLPSGYTFTDLAPLTAYYPWIAADEVTNDSPIIQEAINDAWSDRVDGIIVPSTKGAISRLEDQIVLPSFSATGNTWDESNPFRFHGCGPLTTKFKYVGTDPYAIAHSSMLGRVNRGQNSGVELQNFMLIGPQDWDNPANGIGIDNTRSPMIKNVRIRGFPMGVGIHMWGHIRGGIFGAEIWHCHFGKDVFRTITGVSGAYYHPDDLRDYSLDYAVWYDGPITGTGKVNDTLFFYNRIYNLITGVHKISGHDIDGTYDGDDWGDTTEVNGGSSNTKSSHNMYFLEGCRKMEEGVLAAVTSNTVMRLRNTHYFDAMDSIMTTNGAFGIRDEDGRLHQRYIDAYNPVTREITLDSPLPFVPDLHSGTPTAVTTSTITLAVGASAVDNYYENMSIMVLTGPGAGQIKTVLSYVGATRVATINGQWLDTAATDPPTTASTYAISRKYRVGYVSTASKAKWSDASIPQHVFYFDSGYSGGSFFDYCEETSFLVASVHASADFDIVSPNDVVNDTIYAVKEDGSFYCPRLVLDNRGRGSDQIPAHIVAGSILTIDPDSLGADHGTMGALLNNTGGRIEVGDIVRVSSNGQWASDSVSWDAASGEYVHVVVASAQRTYFEDQSMLTYAVGGRWDVKVNAATSPGDLLLPWTGNIATPIDPATATAEQNAKAMGRAVTVDTNGQCTALLRGW